jgi:predicted YcjX-like family ATPase
MCMCNKNEGYRCFYCEQFIADQIKDYSKTLNLTMTLDDCIEVLNHMDEFEIVDMKTGLWDYLDAYEGVCHSRDSEFFKNEEK